jgi:succinoglycan biosynthesis transport protein ExoP
MNDPKNDPRNESRELEPVSGNGNALGPRYPTIDSAAPEFGPQPRLRDYWEIIFKRRWTILAFMVVATSITAIASFKMQKIYRAAVRLEIEPERSSSATLQNQDQPMATDFTFLQTQVQILSSDTLAWMTIESVGLDRDPRFTAGIPLAGDPDRRRSLLIKRFKTGLHVDMVRDSRLAEVAFEDPDPQRCAAIVNALGRNYVQYNFRKHYEATAQTTEWMTQELDTLKAKVEKSQQAMVAYESANAAINIDDKQNVTLQKLSDVTKQLTDAQGDRIQKESLYRLATSKEHLPNVVQSELLIKLRDLQSTLEDTYTGLQANYGPGWPAMIATKKRLDETGRQIAAEEQRLLSKLRSDFLEAQSREAALLEAVDRQKVEATHLNQLGIEYSIMKREAETNQNLYNLLLQRMKEASVSEGLRASNIHIVDHALPPLVAIRPQPLLNTSRGLLVGLILGVTCAFAQEYMDNTVKTPDHMEQVTGIMALAVIPELGAGASFRYGFGSTFAEADKNRASNALVHGRPLITNTPTSPFAEAFRSLRTAFLLSQIPNPPVVAAITSATPREGKTSVALNLSLALAQKGASVLLIDGDLRRPAIHAGLGLQNTRGLTTMLTQGVHIDPVKLAASPNLSVLVSGPARSDAADLLSSPAMETLVRQYRGMYDHIIIDTPPLFHFTDAILLGHYADGVVLVASAGTTTRNLLRRAFRALNDGRCNVLGTVLNKVDFRSEPYYYSEYSYGYYKEYYGPSASEKRTGSGGA